MRRTYRTNVDDADTALEIEKKTGKVPGVTAVTLSFVHKRLYLEAPEDGFDRTAAAVLAAGRAVKKDFVMEEPAAACGCTEGPEEKKDWPERTAVGRIVFGVAAMAVGAWLEYFVGADLPVLMAVYGLGLLVVGSSVFWGALVRIAHLKAPDEKLLMSIAALGAFAIGECLEGLAVLLFYEIGEYLEDRAVDNSRRSIAAMLDVQAKTATVLRDGRELTVDPAEVAVGERVLVRPGERIPLDGRVVAGESFADTSALTGEAVPRHLRPGDEALSGCINTTAALTIEVTKPYADSTVSRILVLIEDSASRKSSSERFITKFARYYTPAVVAAAFLVAAVPSLLWPELWQTYLYYGLIFLVVSCPCALVVSVPLGFYCGLGCASRHGILIKGSNYLEALARADTVVFDKTGTLTTGEFAVHHIHPETMDETAFLDLTAGAECRSDHPIAASIQQRAGHPIDPARVGASQNFAGKGVLTVVDGQAVRVGNLSLMQDAGIAGVCGCGPVGTNVHVAVDSTYAGHLVISDALKKDAAQAVRDLHAAGIGQVRMLTGDNRAVAAAVAAELGLDGFDAELLPADKTARLDALIAAEPQGRTVVYVGDGINDAPTLALADAGIAMGAYGADAAIEAADVVIMDDNPAKVATAIGIAKHTSRIVRQNIVFALTVKFAILALTPFGFIDMWIAIFGDVGVLLIAVVNSLRALRCRDRPAARD